MTATLISIKVRFQISFTSANICFIESEAYKLAKPTTSKYRRDEESDEETGVLENILGATTKPSEKKKELDSRVKVKAKALDRITPVAEFKTKTGEKSGDIRRRERKERIMKGKKIPTPQEMRERKKHRRIAVPLSKLNK